jgi:hypothetical protein
LCCSVHVKSRVSPMIKSSWVPEQVPSFNGNTFELLVYLVNFLNPRCDMANREHPTIDRSKGGLLTVMSAIRNHLQAEPDRQASKSRIGNDTKVEIPFPNWSAL